MPLGGRWHKHSDIEIIPVLVPTLIVDEHSPEYNDFALPGEYLVLEGMTAYKITETQRQTYFICDEAPELSLPTITPKDML